MSSAHLAPVRSRIVLMATVEPCRNSAGLGERGAGLLDARLDAIHQRLRRGERLAQTQAAARLVEGGNIGEGAANIGGEPQGFGLGHGPAIAENEK